MILAPRVITKEATSNPDFPKLKIKIRPELVAFGNPDEIKVDANGVIGGGVHLRPEEVNKLVEERGDDVVFFDGRNAFEAKVGKFKDAIVPNVETSHDFVAEIESGKYDHMKENFSVTLRGFGLKCRNPLKDLASFNPQICH